MSGSGNDHIIKSYDEELARLTGEIVRMGELAVAQIQAACTAVAHRDPEGARVVVANDALIDQLEHAIGHDVVRLLALRAPMAGDLRSIFAALRIAAEIERIGDHAANIAKRAIALSMVAPMESSSALAPLGTLAAAAVRKVLQAYRDGDAASAHQVWAGDAELDHAYTRYFQRLIACMQDDPRHVAPCAHLLFMAKSIERIGDHATNIAENVWFQVNGEPLQGQRDNRDLTTDG